MNGILYTNPVFYFSSTTSENKWHCTFSSWITDTHILQKKWLILIFAIEMYKSENTAHLIHKILYRNNVAIRERAIRCTNWYKSMISVLD